MLKLADKQQQIIAILLKNSPFSSSQIHLELEKFGEKTSLITTKRAVSKLVEQKILQTSGAGRSVVYTLNILGRTLADVDAKEYCSIEPDKRYGLKQYNFNLFSGFPKEIFSKEELVTMKAATLQYKQRTKNLSATIQKKELERLVIELSWKSSKIEGNTYTLLDTEKLLLENKVAPNKTKEETQMILNHKEAFNFIHKNSELFKNIGKKNLEELHKILVKNLNIDISFRKKPVGITGSAYRPLDNFYQIGEAVEELDEKISRAKTPYDKSFLALIGLSYIQPFEDGNKRTSRLMANALLLAHGLAPLSYRSIDEEEYREALLVFYELNAVKPFKKIFIEQYIFAANNYLVK
ncbi:MAG: Fic family protein [Candidatus Uhrbacteria bacterium]